MATGSWLDATKHRLLDQTCLILHHAFGGPPYLVGSCLERPDYRDVDVRLILDDEEYAALFPGSDRVPGDAHARFSVLSASISLWLQQACGLPVDFQFQQQTAANARYSGRRDPLGIFPAFGPAEDLRRD